MIQQAVLQELFQVRLDLENRLMDLSPGTDTDRQAQYRALARKRDQVYMTINQVLAAEFNEVFSAPVDGLLKQLADTTSALKAVATTFESINGAIGKVDEVLQVAQEVVAAATKIGV
jgi:hypothetical protein